MNPPPTSYQEALQGIVRTLSRASLLITESSNRLNSMSIPAADDTQFHPNVLQRIRVNHFSTISLLTAHEVTIGHLRQHVNFLIQQGNQVYLEGWYEQEIRNLWARAGGALDAVRESLKNYVYIWLIMNARLGEDIDAMFGHSGFAL